MEAIDSHARGREDGSPIPAIGGEQDLLVEEETIKGEPGGLGVTIPQPVESHQLHCPCRHTAEAWKQKLSSGPCLEGTLVPAFEPGCVRLFAILGISVKQIMKLESEDKVSSFPLPAPPSLCWPRATPPAEQRARWELPGESGPQQPSLEQEWGVESTQVPERDSFEFQRASGLGWRLLERKSRK